MNQPLTLTTPEQILILRRRRDWTQTRLAHESGLSQNTIRKIERNYRDVMPSTLEAVFWALRNGSGRDNA